MANADISGNQITVTWHVDYLKVSHKDHFEIKLFAQYLSTKYGEQLDVKCGKVQDCLGMDLDYSTNREIKIGMIKYLQKAEKEFPEPILGTAK